MPGRPDSYAKGGEAEPAPSAHGSALTAAVRKARRRRGGKNAQFAQGRLTPVAERGRGAQNKGAGGGAGPGGWGPMRPPWAQRCGSAGPAAGTGGRPRGWGVVERP